MEEYNQSPEYPCTTPWGEQLRNVLLTFRDGYPRYRDNLWRGVFERDEARQMFSASPNGEKTLEEKIFQVAVYLSREDLWKRIGTLSYVKTLEKTEGLMEVRHIYEAQWMSTNVSLFRHVEISGDVR